MPPHATRSQRRRQSERTQQRRQARAARPLAPPPASVDYSQDYAAVRYDLKLIAIWSVIIFAGMFAMYFVI